MIDHDFRIGLVPIRVQTKQIAPFGSETQTASLAGSVKIKLTENVQIFQGKAIDMLTAATLLHITIVSLLNREFYFRITAYILIARIP